MGRGEAARARGRGLHAAFSRVPQGLPLPPARRAPATSADAARSGRAYPSARPLRGAARAPRDSPPSPRLRRGTSSERGCTVPGPHGVGALAFSARGGRAEESSPFSAFLRRDTPAPPSLRYIRRLRARRRSSVVTGSSLTVVGAPQRPALGEWGPPGRHGSLWPASRGSGGGRSGLSSRRVGPASGAAPRAKAAKWRPGPGRERARRGP